MDDLNVSRPRVIIIDDHPGVRAAAVSILSRSCDVLDTLADGRLAVEAALRLRPHVIVLDIVMPELDGFDVCDRLLSSASCARIVFLSNHTANDFILESFARGGHAFVSKLRMALDLSVAVAHACAGRAFVPDAGLLPLLGRAECARHALQLHATDVDLLNGAVEFLDSALQAGHSVVALVANGHEAMLEQQLAIRGHDVSTLTATGRYVSRDARAVAEAILADGRATGEGDMATLRTLVDQTLEPADGSSPHVSVFSEMSAVLHSDGRTDDMLHLEERLNTLSASTPISFLCACGPELHLDEPQSLARQWCQRHSSILPVNTAQER